MMVSQLAFNFFGTSPLRYIKDTIRKDIEAGNLSKSDAIRLLEDMRMVSRARRNEAYIGEAFSHLRAKYVQPQADV